jgi:nitrate reductase gamma subunit
MADILLYILVLVSIIIGFYFSRALSKHIYGKDYNKQKIFPIFNQLKIFSKTQRMIIIGIPICVALVCAILFRLISNNKISETLIALAPQM